MTGSHQAVSRRQFLACTAAGVTASLAPGVVTASKTNSQLIVGEGDHRFEVTHAWAQLPDQYTWQTTHNVAVDLSGLR